MRWARCVGAATLIAMVMLGVTGARPALAAAPAVSLNTPVADSLQTAAFAITGSTTQDGNDAVIRSVKVKLSDDDGWLPPVEHSYAAGGSANSSIFTGGGANVSFNWTAITPKYNGPYTVTVTSVGEYRPALSGPVSQQTVVSKSFHVEIAPATPTGVTAEKPDDSSLVTVKWKANPESDIAGYVVYRSYAGDAGKQIGSVDGDKLSYTDDLAGKAQGQYKYAVQAVRHARSCKSASNTDEACTRGIAGKNSAYSSSVTVRATVQTTTTTTIKKGGGGSTGGGSTGGGSTGGGSTGGGSSSGGGRTATARPGTNGSGFAPGGNVDLSQFGNLLNPRAGGGSARPGEPEGTYDPSLPYNERAPQQSTDDDALITIGGATVPKPSDDWVKFIGAGSLATSLLVHVLWFKQQVDAVPLEPIVE